MSLSYFAPPIQQPILQLDTPKKPIPLQVKLLDIETESGLKFKRFSDGTDRQFKSVSAIKDKLSFFDKMGVSEKMAEKEINKKGIYAPDALAFGYDPALAEWYVVGGREAYDNAYNEYCAALKAEQDALLTEWERRGNVGKERGNFVDIAFEYLMNRQTFNAHQHCAEHNLYQETPFTTEYLVKFCEQFARFKKFHLLDILCGKNAVYVTQYLAHANVTNGNYGFATLGDLLCLDPDNKTYYLFDVKADKSEKMYPKKSYYKPKQLLGEMAYFEETLQNKYFFQVMCSHLAIYRTGGVWNGNVWIDLQGWNYGGGGIIHWDSDKMIFNPIHMPPPPREKKDSLSPFEILKQQSGLFIRGYFINLKNEKDAKSRISSV